MKMRNKKGGKVHPFTSSSYSPTNKEDPSSILKLLPAAILTLVSLLSPDDRHVLAYMLSRSLHPNPNPDPPNPSPPPSACCSAAASFYCDCFHCYTSFWLRWDSSPNRDLIHRAIEAFEDHLANPRKSRKKDRIGRRRTEKAGARVPDFPAPGHQKENAEVPEGEAAECVIADVAEERPTEDAESPVVAAAAPCSHKGLARKVLPDVMGIFSSRLWSLWSPNV